MEELAVVWSNDRCGPEGCAEGRPGRDDEMGAHSALARSSGKRLPLLAKSRLVVQGHKEIGDFRCDSPTASLLAFNLLCSIAASKKWTLVAGDAPNAYLQGDPLQRLLVLMPPKPSPDPALKGKYLVAAFTGREMQDVVSG